MVSKRPRWELGSIVQIPLAGGAQTYGILRKEPLCSILDCRTERVLSVAEIMAHNVHCSVWVAGRALAEWPRVATITLPTGLLAPVTFAKRDPISGRLFTYTEGAERPATAAELASLEIAAVWDPKHVVDRLNDYYAGERNIWLDSLRIDLLSGPRVRT